MTSEDLVDLGFHTWRGFSLSEEKPLLSRIPKTMGVYAVRDRSLFGRYRGKSDIVYIGSSVNSDGLKRRIRFYFHPGPTQKTSQRINGLLRQLSSLEIAWVESDTKEGARELEKHLREKYYLDHLELPPFNRQG